MTVPGTTRGGRPTHSTSSTDDRSGDDPLAVVRRNQLLLLMTVLGMTLGGRPTHSTLSTDDHSGGDPRRSSDAIFLDCTAAGGG